MCWNGSIHSDLKELPLHVHGRHIYINVYTPKSVLYDSPTCSFDTEKYALKKKEKKRRRDEEDEEEEK